MINRKNGETHTQFIKRLESYIEVLKDNNRSLRILNADQNKLNPRTGRTYEQEAKELFISMALIELNLRENNIEFANIVVQGQLEALGFNPVDIATNKCLEDNAYNG